MRAFVALIRRELIEHRGAFLFAPAILLTVLTAGVLLSILTGRLRLPFEVTVPAALKFYEVGLLAMTQVWWFYLLAALIFYYADAFTADRRNNSMLFWKSMPVSDFTVLLSKLVAGLTVFPAISFLIAVATGLVIYALSLVASLTMPGWETPAIGAVVEGSVGIIGFAATWLVLALLWYAPFFAWVGFLSTLFGRWALPLAGLIPAVAAALENALFFRRDNMGGGAIYQFLWERIQLGIDWPIWMRAAFGPGRVDAGVLRADLLTHFDWVSLGGGLAVALVLVLLASEYRRRYIIV